MRRETQDGFRQRLRQEGRFQDFSARRKDLQAEGLSPSESWDRAAAEFGFGDGDTSVGVTLDGVAAGATVYVAKDDLRKQGVVT